MEYIGFVLILIGLAGTAGGITKGHGITCAAVMAETGAVLMLMDKKRRGDGRNEDSKEADSADHCGSSTVDKPAGEGGGRC